MSRINFGSTWWGEKWLDALTHIDYENRLPRGKSYARNGSVANITINGNTIRASVQGTQRKPYRVLITVPQFQKKEENIIIDVITQNKIFLSRLLTRKLSPELYNELQQKNLELFPRKWGDLNASCSCPDWAVPCKHIAATIYIVANEIDKNPFLVFGIRDFDIFAALEKQGYSQEQTKNTHIPSVQHILAGHTEKKKRATKQAKEPLALDAQRLESIDFSIIPDIREHILSFFSDNPLFYPGSNFKARIKKIYQELAKTHVLLAEAKRNASIERDTEEYTQWNAIIDPALQTKLLLLATQDGKYTIDATQKFENLVEYLEIIPPAKLAYHSNQIIALSLIYRFVLRLLEQGAFTPQLIQTHEKIYKIRWIPALLNEQVKTVVNQLIAVMPLEMLGITTAQAQESKQSKRVNKGTAEGNVIYPDAHEQALFLTSLFFQHYIEKTAQWIDRKEYDLITDLFFQGKPLTANSFETQELPQTINLWLSKFFITHKDLVPLLKIETDADIFTVEVLAENTRENISEPIPLSNVLHDKQYHANRADVMRDLTILAEAFPQIEKVMKAEGDEMLSFNSQEFVDVFFTALPTVRLLGIQILLPKELQELITPKLTLNLEKKTKSDSVTSYLSLDDTLSFDWRVALGDTFVDPEEFKRLIENARGIIKLKDRYIYVDENEIKKLLKGLQDGPRLSHHDLLKTVLTGEYDTTPIKISEEVFKLIQSLLDIKKIPLPELAATLRHYQERGYWWLYKNAKVGFGSLIADDMGLGKTLQVITTALKLKEEGILEKQPGLVIVPTTLLTNWQREIEKFAPNLKAHVYHGQGRKFTRTGYDLFITTYGTARRESEKLSKDAWAFMVIDEAQNIKNANTTQTKAIKSIPSPIKIAMTGTPVENRLSEYWSIMDFLNMGYLGGPQSFHDNFSEPIEHYRDHKALERFRQITSPFIMRRVKTDKTIIKDLPQKNEIDQFCALTKEQASLYQTTVDAIMEEIEKSEGIERRGLLFKLMTALKQICNHPSHYLKKKSADYQLSGKTALLLELLQTIYENDEKVLLFTQYTEMGNLLVKMLDEHFKSEPLFLHGGISRKKRDEMVDRFQNERHINSMILSLKAGGTGLNLTAATSVIHVDLWWNPAVEQQATDRAYRIGQKKNVMVHRMITKNTFEEKINEMIKEKKELADLTVTKGEKWIGELSNKELRRLFQMG
jgi:SNF2 family DNA or RNA helicase/uncharacterized Zn finger protein